MEVGVAVAVAVGVATADCWMKMPKAMGLLPTGMVALTVFVAVLITDTVLAMLFAT